MLTVTTPAQNTALTTLDNVKTELSILTTDEDAYLSKLILRVSSGAAGQLNFGTAEDGTVTLGREDLVETIDLNTSCFRRHRSHDMSIALSRLPVVSIASVEEDGTALTSDQFESTNALGFLYRLSGECRVHWRARKLVVTYTAGWLLPDDTGRNFPEEFEGAVIAWIKALRFNRSRDPLLQAENILGGLYSYRNFSPSDFPEGIPIEMMRMFDQYRRPVIV